MVVQGVNRDPLNLAVCWGTLEPDPGSKCGFSPGSGGPTGQIDEAAQQIAGFPKVGHRATRTPIVSKVVETAWGDRRVGGPWWVGGWVVHGSLKLSCCFFNVS